MVVVYISDRHWVGGTEDWDDTAGTKWALTEGGAGGQAVPTIDEDVFLDAGSGAVTVTINTLTVYAKSLTCTGFTGTLAGSNRSLCIGNGNFLLVSGMNYTQTGTILFAGTTTGLTVTTAGKTITANMQFNGEGGGWILQDAITLNSKTFSVPQGDLDLNGNNITGCTVFDFSSSSYTKTLTFGDAIVNCTSADFTGTGLTLEEDTGTIKVTGSGAFAGNSNTFYNVELNGTAHTVSGTNTFNNLTRTGTATKTDTLTISANQTVNGILTLTSNSAINRLLVTSNSIGTARTLTCTGATVTSSNCDFKDITIVNGGTVDSVADDGAGNARVSTNSKTHNMLVGDSITIAGTTNYNGTHIISTVSDTTHIDIPVSYVSSQSGTWTGNANLTVGLSGNCGGNTGITFTTADDCFWVHGANASYNWSESQWSTSTGGSLDQRVPLPQDTAKFDAGSFAADGKTVVQDMPRIGTTTFADTDQSFTWTTSTAASVFGSLTLDSNMTLTVSSQTYTFEGRGSYTLTNAGKTWGKTINLNAVNSVGTLTLKDDFILSGTTLQIQSGTLDFVDTDQNHIFNVMSTNFSGGMTNLGSGTHILTGSAGTTFTVSGNVINAGTSTIKFTGNSTGLKTLNGGTNTYYNLWFNTGNTGHSRINGTNVFNNITYDNTNTTAELQFTAGTTQTVTTFTMNGTVGNLIKLTSVTPGTHAHLSCVSGTITVDYLSIKDNQGIGGATFNATNSTDAGGNSGWNFASGSTGMLTMF